MGGKLQKYPAGRIRGSSEHTCSRPSRRCRRLIDAHRTYNGGGGDEEGGADKSHGGVVGGADQSEIPGRRNLK